MKNLLRFRNKCGMTIAVIATLFFVFSFMSCKNNSDDDVPTTYTVTFNPNGGTIATTTQTVTANTATALTKASALGLTREGYTFTGWSKTSDSTEVAYTDGASVMLSADLTLYAIWTTNPARTYTVTITGGANATRSGGKATQNGLSGAMTPVIYTANSGYYFEDFTDITSNGITATKTSSRVVTISGTPTANTNITVPDAVNMLVTPLSIEALTAGTIVVKNPQSGMQYTKNDGEKTSMSATTNISVVKGDKVTFYGNGKSITCYNGTEITSSDFGFTCKVYGNIMSLVDETGYAVATTLSENNAFCNLFNDNISITDASGLLLPATTLTDYCYSNMFNYCTRLKAAPALPATTLTIKCYQGMFCSCSSLTAAPELPATSLAEECYALMFQYCTGLTTAPALPATTLANGCYAQMFQICTSLTSTPELPATTLTKNCYLWMFKGCSNLNSVTCRATDISADYCTSDWLSDVASTGTFTAASSATWSEGNTSGIPTGWTRVNQ